MSIPNKILVDKLREMIPRQTYWEGRYVKMAADRLEALGDRDPDDGDRRLDPSAVDRVVAITIDWLGVVAPIVDVDRATDTHIRDLERRLTEDYVE